MSHKHGSGFASRHALDALVPVLLEPMRNFAVRASRLLLKSNFVIAGLVCKPGNRCLADKGPGRLAAVVAAAGQCPTLTLLLPHPPAAVTSCR